MERKIPHDPRFQTIYQILVPLDTGNGWWSYGYRIGQEAAIEAAHRIGDGIVIPHLVIHMTEAVAWRLGVELVAPLEASPDDDVR